MDADRAVASGRGDAAWLVALGLLAGALLLANLGNQQLWQDEAQTALLARSVLAHGVPLGSDGVNSFSQELTSATAGWSRRCWRWLSPATAGSISR